MLFLCYISSAIGGECWPVDPCVAQAMVQLCKPLIQRFCSPGCRVYGRTAVTMNRKTPFTACNWLLITWGQAPHATFTRTHQPKTNICFHTFYRMLFGAKSRLVYNTFSCTKRLHCKAFYNVYKPKWREAHFWLLPQTSLQTHPSPSSTLRNIHPASWP